MSVGKCTILTGLCLVWGLGGCGEDSNAAGAAGSAGSAGAAATVEPVCADPAAPSDCDCKHPPVTARCKDGWCVVPAGCYVIGEPEDVVHGPIDDRVEMTLSRAFSIQQHETTWADWKAAGLVPDLRPYQGPDPNDRNTFVSCSEPNCPAARMTWFDALDYANRRSERAGLSPCYTLTGCTKTENSLTACAAVTLSTESVYFCRGYRLPTDVEWEVAARAGWTSPGLVDTPGSVIRVAGGTDGKTQATKVHPAVQGRRGSSREDGRQDDRGSDEGVRPDRDSPA